MKETSLSTARMVAACVIGICLEGFDFIVYSLFAFIIAKQFFPTGNEAVSFLLALLSLGLAYVIRPLGGIFWGIYADKVGRRPALAWLSIVMAVGTAIIAFTPTYASIGLAAPILMLLARLIQGFSVSGEFASATAMLIEYAPPGRKALYASYQMAAQIFTVGVGSALVLVLTQSMSPAILESWGWRIPFVVGILIGPVGYYIRSRLSESPEFVHYVETRGRSTRTPFVELFAKFRWQALCGAGLVVVGSSAFYLILIFLPIFAARQLHIGMFDAQISTIICCFIQVAVCLFAGWLADRVGARAILLPASIVYLVIAYPLFSQLIAAPSFWTLLLAQGVTNFVLGFLSGPLPSALSGLFPVPVRSSGIGIVYNAVGAIFGGLGPFIISSLIAATGDNASPAYWAAATGFIGAVAAYFLRRISAESANETTAALSPPASI